MATSPTTAARPLADAPPALDWQTETLAAQLSPLWPGIRIEVVASAVSTNSTLLARARSAGATASTASRDRPGIAACVLVAEQQTGGRGRLGRAWQSQRGASLTFTLALPFAPADWSGLSLAVGVALAEALDGDGVGRGDDGPVGAAARGVGGVRPRIRLKWPNDLWLVASSMAADGDAAARTADGAGAAGAGRKLGGILIETVPIGGQRLAVIGVGLNVLPFAARTAVTTGMACLREIDARASAPRTLARVLPALGQALRQFEQAGFAAFGARYAARDALAGRAVRLATTGGWAAAGQADGDRLAIARSSADDPFDTGPADGRAEGVDRSGALLVRSAAGRLLRVIGGEVSVRPLAWLRPPPESAS